MEQVDQVVFQHPKEVVILVPSEYGEGLIRLTEGTVGWELGINPVMCPEIEQVCGVLFGERSAEDRFVFARKRNLKDCEITLTIRPQRPALVHKKGST